MLDARIEIESGHVSVGTMHLAKGLEFRAVAVTACDDEVIPLQERIESVVDDSDLEPTEAELVELDELANDPSFSHLYL